MAEIATTAEPAETKSIGFFDKYLTVWVLICIIAGIAIGYLRGDRIEVLSSWTLYQVNIPVTILIWLMIYPMMLQIDFSSLKEIGKAPKGVVWTIIINWAVKPFSMAFFAWLFFDQLYSAWLSPALVTVVGVLIEVPIMLSLVRIARNRRYGS